MAKIEGLMQEIEEAFGNRTSSISTMYFLKRYFYVFGGVVGVVAGLLLRDMFFCLVIGGSASLAFYHYAESYLLKIDHLFFSSPGRSKREIFDKYYANEVGRRISLRTTEPEQLVKNDHLAIERQRELFQQKLSIELDREFKRSEWRFFVAECLYYQK
jgi:hypothetical protein